MRWYHFIGAYLVISPLFLFAIIPEGYMNLWVVGLLILCIPAGIAIMKYLPVKPEPHWPNYDKLMKEMEEKKRES